LLLGRGFRTKLLGLAGAPELRKLGFAAPSEPRLIGPMWVFIIIIIVEKPQI